MPGIRENSSNFGTPYQITVQGNLDNSWPEWLGALNVSTAREGTGDPLTRIEGNFIDQASLRGVLVRLWDLNVILIGVQRLNPRTEEPTNPMEE